MAHSNAKTRLKLLSDNFLDTLTKSLPQLHDVQYADQLEKISTWITPNLLKCCHDKDLTNQHVSTAAAFDIEDQFSLPLSFDLHPTLKYLVALNQPQLASEATLWAFAQLLEYRSSGHMEEIFPNLEPDYLKN